MKSRFLNATPIEVINFAHKILIALCEIFYEANSIAQEFSNTAVCGMYGMLYKYTSLSFRLPA